MWRWRLMPVLILIQANLNLLIPNTYASPTSAGPTSTEEAQIIWHEGKEAFLGSRFTEATQNLQRLMDRYPADPHRDEALEILGTAYYRLGDTQRSIPLLLAALDAQDSEIRGQQLRLLLGKTYLLAGKYDEALLAVNGIEKASPQLELPQNLRSEATLLKGQALFEKNHLDRAHLAILSLESELPQIHDTDLQNRIYSFRLQVGLMKCARISTAGPLTELQVKDQTERRANCLLDQVIAAKPLFFAKNAKTPDGLIKPLKLAFEGLQEIYRHPPTPPELKDRKRTHTELARYRAELGMLLEPIFKKTLSQAQELLQKWKTGAPVMETELLSTLLNALKKM